MPEVRILQRAQADQLRDDETALVVDVLRATTTVAIALDRGADRVHPVKTPDQALKLADHLEAQGRQVVRVGERARGPLEGFVDNSPATLADMDLAGQDVVMTTTNGTQALLAARPAGTVVAGGLVNAQALIEALDGRDVALVASGWMGRPTRDDDACCEYLAARLQGQAPDLDSFLDRLEASTSATKLREHGRGADVDLCFSLDVTDVVPVMRDGGHLADGDL